MNKTCFITILATLTFSVIARGSERTVLVEAEAFSERGGWVVDQQFMDEMGSPFLLAHGLGIPVKDASTTVTFPAAGTYHIWVRTRDWVAGWKAPGAPGKFQLLVDGKPLKTTFGTEGVKWHWQSGGAVEIAKTKIAVALHDLTGFEGRCDAIVFSSDPKFTPPNELKTMAPWRRKLLGRPETPPDVGEFDLVVVGGGIAGTSAALSAARLGAKVALIQDRPVLGGNNSSEVRVWLHGKMNFQPYPRIGDVVRELDQKRRAHYGPANTADLYEDDRKIALVRAEKNISLFLSHRANGVEMSKGRIAAVIAENINTGCRLRFVSRSVADCTGHGVIGALAGADFQMTRKGHMGRCNLWNVVETDKPAPFPRCPWALDLSDKPFPGRKSGGLKSLGVWYWESGFDHDPFEKGEYIRDWNFRAMYGAWDALKNVDKRYPNHKLNWSAHISGPRESRRIVGDVLLTGKDVSSGKTWPDACVPCTWTMDLHLPNKKYEKGFEGDAFIASAHHTRFKTPYWLPYRCLYSKNIANLFMAGRDVSVTHEALGTVRVMRTCGMMGEIVGMAASICTKRDTTPRGVYKDYLDELKKLMKAGVGKTQTPADASARPKWLGSAGLNLSRRARVTVSSNHPSGKYKSSAINDGEASPVDNDLRWVSDAKPPHRVELIWRRPQTISAIRIVSGWNQGGRIIGALESFSLQYSDSSGWKDIPGGKVGGNRLADWSVRFKPVQANALRLTVTVTQTNTARIWEIETYDPPEKPAK
ncbi:MAG: FAD-dependent oxidoreductase [Phycisphaerae bacterium]|jgi:hypothetical protein|nr:FAD-dependent oxidoreductase [Phycisphaerae bacterium]